jgi:hypothetical protein
MSGYKIEDNSLQSLRLRRFALLRAADEHPLMLRVHWGLMAVTLKHLSASPILFNCQQSWRAFQPASLAIGESSFKSAGITYIHTREGWLLATRQIVG